MSRYLKVLFCFTIVSIINLMLSMINVFIDSEFLIGFVYGVNFVVFGISLFISIDIAIEKRKNNKRMKEKFKEIVSKKFGFREDFDWETRFDLKTQVGEYEVSTVDLGIDHSFGIGEPLYYETMISLKGDTFEKRHSKGNPFEYYQDRYTTEEEARKGHKEAIRIVKKYLKEEK